MSEVAIRVDASVAMGGGHLQRCLSLAHALRACGAGVVFVLRDLGTETHHLLAASAFPSLVLPAPPIGDAPDAEVAHGLWAGVDWHRDAYETCAALRTLAATPHIVVADHYSFDARWHQTVAGELGCKVAVIDDLADRELWGHWLVDHNCHPDHRRKYGNRWPASAVLMGGPSYALLGPVFAEAPRYLVRESVQSIGIFMGSSDPGGMTAVALRACREVAHFDGLIEIVTTHGNPNRDKLAALVRESPPARLLEDLPDLSAFFARHDIQVGAGGGATWERCCVGAPSVLVVCAANQAVVVPEMDRLGLAVGVAAGADSQAIGAAVRRLVDAPSALRRNLSERVRSLVDGLGARRVALCLLGSTGLRLRPITLADASLMHRWRNHDRTRSMSRDAGEVAFESHLQWLVRVLADPCRALWMAHVGEIDVGVIRFDDKPDRNDCEVSLYLDPALHGLGLGPILLQAGEQARLRRGGSAARFAATVLPHNLASRHLFERAGYAFVGEYGFKPFAHTRDPSPEAAT